MSGIIFFIVLLHLVVGFGYLMYKLSPAKKKNETNDQEEKPNV